MQEIIALSIVLLAACYLAWRGYRFAVARRRSACGSACGGCATNEAQTKPLVTIAPAQKSDTT